MCMVKAVFAVRLLLQHQKAQNSIDIITVNRYNVVRRQVNYHDDSGATERKQYVRLQAVKGKHGSLCDMQ